MVRASFLEEYVCIDVPFMIAERANTVDSAFISLSINISF